MVKSAENRMRSNLVEILLTFVYFLECTVVQYKIEIGTAMNARESENYLPISRSSNASK
jgi:hypothetical protein